MSVVLPRRETISDRMPLSPHPSLGGKLTSGSSAVVRREVLRPPSPVVLASTTGSMVAVPCDMKASVDLRSVLPRQPATSRPASPIANRRILSSSASNDVLRLSDRLVHSTTARDAIGRRDVQNDIAFVCQSDRVMEQVNAIIADVIAKMDSIADKQNLMANSFENRCASLEVSVSHLSGKLQADAGEQRVLANDLVPQIRNLEVSYAKISQQLEKEKEAQEMLATDTAFTREILADDVNFKLKALEAHVEEFGVQMSHREYLSCSLDTEAETSTHSAMMLARSSGDFAEMRRWVASQVDCLKAELEDKYIACKAELMECRGEQQRFQLDCESSMGHLTDIVRTTDCKLNELFAYDRTHRTDCMPYKSQVGLLHVS